MKDLPRYILLTGLVAASLPLRHSAILKVVGKNLLLVLLVVISAPLRIFNASATSTPQPLNPYPFRKTPAHYIAASAFDAERGPPEYVGGGIYRDDERLARMPDHAKWLVAWDEYGRPTRRYRKWLALEAAEAQRPSAVIYRDYCNRRDERIQFYIWASQNPFHPALDSKTRKALFLEHRTSRMPS